MTQFGTPKACDFVQPLFHYLITPLLYDITKYKIKYVYFSLRIKLNLKWIPK